VAIHWVWPVVRSVPSQKCGHIGETLQSMFMSRRFTKKSFERTPNVVVRDTPS